MSDQLALATAIEDAGIKRDKADRIASVIFDAIRESTATKADNSDVGDFVQGLQHDVSRLDDDVEEALTGHREIRSDFAALRADVHTARACHQLSQTTLATS
jgi:hypothetical protein